MHRRQLWLVYLLCLVPRLAAVLLLPGSPRQNYHWVIATSLLEGGGFATPDGATTFHDPGYALFLAAARLIAADHFAIVMIVQAMVAALGGVFLFALTRDLTGQARAAWIAASLYAFYPYYVRQTHSLIELPLLVTTLAAALWSFHRRPTLGSAAWSGVIFGTLMLVRPALAPLWLIAVLAAGWTRPAAWTAVFTICGALVFAPWVIRSQGIDGSVVPTRIGENLFVSTNELSLDIPVTVDVDLLVPFADEIRTAALARENPPPHLRERVADAALVDYVIAFARAHPWTTLRLKLRALAYVFAPVIIPSHARTDAVYVDTRARPPRLVNAQPRHWFEHVAHSTASGVVLIAGAVGLFLRRRQLRTELLLPATILVHAATYAVFFPTTRLVSPMSVVLMTYAGVALAAAWRRQ